HLVKTKVKILPFRIEQCRVVGLAADHRGYRQLIVFHKIGESKEVESHAIYLAERTASFGLFAAVVNYAIPVEHKRPDTIQFLPECLFGAQKSRSQCFVNLPDIGHVKV